MLLIHPAVITPLRCGFCTSLHPELLRAAAVLRAEGIDAHIATVDGTAERSLAEEEGLEGYPTINLYKRGV